MLRSAALTAVLGLAGCHNACQQICDRMASRAEECGVTVPDDELAACYDRMADLKPTDEDEPSRQDVVGVCQDYGDLETIRDEVSCEAISQYWASAAE